MTSGIASAARVAPAMRSVGILARSMGIIPSKIGRTRLDRLVVLGVTATSRVPHIDSVVGVAR